MLLYQRICPSFSRDIYWPIKFRIFSDRAINSSCIYTLKHWKKLTSIHGDVHTEVRNIAFSRVSEQIKEVVWARNPFHFICSRYVRYIIIVTSVWFYGYSKCSETSMYIRKEWAVMSRGSIKMILVETVAYVFTGIPLLFGQYSPYFFLKNGLQLLKKMHLKWYVNMEELNHKAGHGKYNNIWNWITFQLIPSYTSKCCM